MNIVVTGGAGFIGSHFVDLALADPDIQSVRVIDSLTYAGSKRNLSLAGENKKFNFVQADILITSTYSDEIHAGDLVVNFAAESHVDNSIIGPDKFFQTNALGVSRLIQTCMNNDVRKFLQVSTDEVYGSIITGEVDETDNLNPSSPYAASKAGGDLFSLSFWKTFQFPINVTRGANTFGPRQYPEKLIPLALERMRKGQRVPVYGSGLQSREWIHVHDHARAILTVLKHGVAGEIYNIGSGIRLTNIEVIEKLKRAIGADFDVVAYVEDRKGHDFRYAISSQKIRKELGWIPISKFGENFTDIESW
jgi:dTDP-glucose 4,6-dehydratase